VPVQSWEDVALGGARETGLTGAGTPPAGITVRRYRAANSRWVRSAKRVMPCWALPPAAFSAALRASMSLSVSAKASNRSRSSIAVPYSRPYLLFMVCVRARAWCWWCGWSKERGQKGQARMG